jgi:hypothetical protein
MKDYDYIIVLRKRDYTLVDMISRLMLMLSIAVFVYLISLVGKANRVTILLAALILGMIGWWIYCYTRQKKGEMSFYRLGLLMATIGWGAISGISWITILFFLAVISEKQVKFPQEFAFDDEGIVVNSLPRKYYLWAQVTNVVLKDGILTIDFKNNKLIQKPIESYTSANEEQEFNEFCKSRLNAF